MAIKEHFINSGVIEMNRDWRDASRQEDEIEARVFQGHGYAWVGPEPVWFTSQRSRETCGMPISTRECSCRSVCAFSNCLSACLPDTTFHDVILFEDGSALILSYKNSNFYDCTKDLRTAHYFEEQCISKQISYRAWGWVFLPMFW